jgi:hypothetical protein
LLIQSARMTRLHDETGARAKCPAGNRRLLEEVAPDRST